jgi:hypothetical protein
VGRDSSVTRYGLDVAGIESQWRRNFSHPSRPAHPPSYTMGTGSFPGIKRPGRGVDHPPSSSTEVKERAELYLYSPSGPSWLVLGCNLHISHTGHLCSLWWLHQRAVLDVSRTLTVGTQCDNSVFLGYDATLCSFAAALFLHLQCPCSSFRWNCIIPKYGCCKPLRKVGQ